MPTKCLKKGLKEKFSGDELTFVIAMNKFRDRKELNEGCPLLHIAIARTNVAIAMSKCMAESFCAKTVASPKLPHFLFYSFLWPNCLIIHCFKCLYARLMSLLHYMYFICEKWPPTTFL